MQKTVRRSASLLFVLTLAAAIVIPTVADPISQITGGSADSGNSGSDQAAAAENYALSEDVSGVGEPAKIWSGSSSRWIRLPCSNMRTRRGSPLPKP